MSKIKVIIHEEAEIELWHAVEFYEDKVRGLGLDFENEIQSALISIQENPTRYAEAEEGIRRCLLRRFPYIIYFIDGQEYLWIVPRFCNLNISRANRDMIIIYAKLRKNLCTHK